MENLSYTSVSPNLWYVLKQNFIKIKSGNTMPGRDISELYVLNRYEKITLYRVISI